jgi:hypothetical protein
VTILVYQGWIFFLAQIYMAELLNPKVEAHGIFDVVAIGIAKQLEEKLTAPVIGNGTFVSAAIKGVGGGLIHGKGGRIGNIVSSALLVDAGEDAALSILNIVGLGAGGDSSGGTSKAWWN